jgi:hypothetical protein
MLSGESVARSFTLWGESVAVANDSGIVLMRKDENIRHIGNLPAMVSFEVHNLYSFLTRD